MNIRRNEPTEGIVSRLFNAANKGSFDGNYITPYLESCRWYIERIDAQVVMTRDMGYHTSGWWKNPDYERCYHLSIDYPGGMNLKKTEWLLCALFGSNRKLMWCEPPYSEHRVPLPPFLRRGVEAYNAARRSVQHAVHRTWLEVLFGST